MPLPRLSLLGPPHTYLVQVATALDLPRLAETGACDCLRNHLELLREVFDINYYAWNIHAGGFFLVLRHRHLVRDSDQRLRQRWALLGSKTLPRPDQLRQRLTTLSGYMQTLLQTASRRLQHTCGGPGTWWSPRYRACLLADDSALLACVCALEQVPLSNHEQCATSYGQRALPDHRPHLATLPFSLLPNNEAIPRDTAPLGVTPPRPGQDAQLLEGFCGDLQRHHLQHYAQVIQHSWALGRPESLTETLSRLGRGPGRGRSRRLRELDDDLGLCGVWG